MTRILVVDDRRSSAERLTSGLASRHSVTVEADPQQALFRATEELIREQRDLLGYYDSEAELFGDEPPFG